MEKRIHKFYLNQKHIITDTYSGSIQVVDPIVYAIVEDTFAMDKASLMNKYRNVYDKQQTSEAYEEIQEMIRDGMLFSPSIQEERIHYNPEHIIKAMCLHVSHDCDLRCKYCFASQGNFSGERLLMSYETGRMALDFLVRHSGNRKNLEVDFFGGEPLLNFDVVKKLVCYGYELNKKYDKNIRFTITTNGVKLDDDKIDFINQHMQNVVMSLDGRKAVNDRMRPTANHQGSYDLIVPKFKKLIAQRQDKDYYIRGTFTSDNLDFALDALSYYHEGFLSVSLEPVVAPPTESYALRREHLSQIEREYEKLSQAYIKIKRLHPKFQFFHFMIDLDDGPCLAKRSIGCGAGLEYIAVTPLGEIYPCHQFVGDKKFLLGDLDFGITDQKLQQEFAQTSIFTKTDCRDCWAKFYCSGGCHANAYYQNGTIQQPDGIGCQMERKRIECAISILANLEDSAILSQSS